MRGVNPAIKRKLMKNQSDNYLILGGTGSFGYAFTQEVLSQGKHATLLVRSLKKAQQLFGTHPQLELIEGDAFDTTLMASLAKDHGFILHALNVPYQNWAKQMMPLTESVIQVASENHATLLFPGNVYNYGLNTTGITETSPEKPISSKGKLRQQLESKLKKASTEGLKVVILRLPDFWGPNVTHAGMAPLFKGALQGKKMPWLINNSIPHQLVYNKDAGAVMYRLSQEVGLPDYALFHFGGHILPSMAAFTSQLTEVAGTSAKPSVTPKWMMSILSLFVPVVKQLKEMFYLYENNIYLDDSKLKSMYPDLQLTPLPKAMDETLDWFRGRK